MLYPLLMGSSPADFVNSCRPEYWVGFTFGYLSACIVGAIVLAAILLLRRK